MHAYVGTDWLLAVCNDTRDECDLNDNDGRQDLKTSCWLLSSSNKDTPLQPKIMTSIRVRMLLAALLAANTVAVRILKDPKAVATTTTASSSSQAKSQHASSTSTTSRDYASSSSSSDPFYHRRFRSSSSSYVTPTGPDDHLVTSPLPLWHGSKPFPTSHWAGHLPASKGDDDKYLFYWLFAPDFSNFNSTASSSSVPLIIWLNGGPGCSSMDGLWLENGPFRLTIDTTTGAYGVTTDPYSWHMTPAYTLYIDQPVGTGLSFTMSGTYPGNDNEVNVDFYVFLQSFFQLHADKFVLQQQVNRPVYFSGESHAGHYIPSMMNYILHQNDQLSSGGTKSSSTAINMPLAGAAIGNGWVDPYHQYAAAEAAYGKGLIGRSQWHALDKKEQDCQSRLSKGDYTAGVCFALLNDVVDQSQGTSLGYKVSTYDARRSEPKHAARTFPPGHKVVETYLGGWDLVGDVGTLSSDVAPQVLEIIHATAAKSAKQVYQECTDPPYEALAHQDGIGVVNDVIQVLQHTSKPRLLFFNGIEDLICNHVGNEKLLESLPWKGKDAWIQSPRYAWRATGEVEGQVSGYMKEYDNLSFLKVLNAGHMVPMDVPDVGLEMMRIFTGGPKLSFSQSRQGLANAPDDNSCAVCEECPTCDDTQGCNDDAPKCEPCNSSSSQPSNHVAATDASINKGLIGGIVFVSSLLGGVLVFFVCRSDKRHAARSLVPQYDLELRPRQYMDEPSNGIEIS